MYPPSGVKSIEFKINPLFTTAPRNDWAVSVNDLLHRGRPIAENFMMRPLVGSVELGCPKPTPIKPPSDVGFRLIPEPKKLVRSCCQTIVPVLLNLANQAQGWQKEVELSSPEKMNPPSVVALTKVAHCLLVAQSEY